MVRKKECFGGQTIVQTIRLCLSASGVELPRTVGRKLQLVAPPSMQRDKTDEVVLSVQRRSSDVLGLAVYSFNQPREAPWS